jgi:hypothetical protein
MTHHTPDPLQTDARLPQGGSENDAIGDDRLASRPENSRRRLLKAAAVSPAVLTLHSGAVQAASSTLRCLQNTVDQPNGLFTTLNTPKYHAWKMESRSAYRCAKVTVTEVVSETGEALSTITQEFNADKKIIVNYGSRQGYRDASGVRYEMVINGNTTLFKQGFTGYYYAIEGNTDRVRTYAYVDNDGNVQGTGPYYSKHYKAVPASCYTSIHPRRT